MLRAWVLSLGDAYVASDIIIARSLQETGVWTKELVGSQQLRILLMILFDVQISAFQATTLYYWDASLNLVGIVNQNNTTNHFIIY